MSSVIEREQEIVTEVSTESVLLDADLFVKYKSPEKALQLLRDSIRRSPRSIALREKLREICISHKNSAEASKQCLALVSLYIAKEDFDIAYDRLQEAKLLDPRISVAPGLEAIRRARRPDFAVNRERSNLKVRTDVTFAGDLAFVGLFDAVQVIENSRMTGLLVMKSDKHLASVSFNEGKIVDADADGMNGVKAFRVIIEICSGTFEFNLSPNEFPVVIDVNSNTNFILDTLTCLETEKAERSGMRSLSTTELEV